MGSLRRTSLAPAGNTPLLRVRAKHRQKVSVVGALLRSVRSGRGQLVHETFVDRYVDDFFYAEFLQERVMRATRRPVLLVQDNAPLHRGPCTQEVIEDFYPRLTVYQFPAYAPELNPMEQVWTWSKHHELANFVPEDLDQLAIATEYAIETAEHDQQRLQSFFAAAKLPW